MGTDESPSSNPVDVFNLAARWRPGPEWNKIEQGIDSEPVPSHLNTINSSGMFHIVSADKMSVRYGGNQQIDHGVGVVQADCAAPVKRTAYYFEMTVKNAGLKGQMGIGFTNQQIKMRRQPGWDTNSCGYHGDDGYLYRGYGIGESFGPTFTAGDTVGAGINYASQEFFFTKNENLVGTVIKDIKGPLYPTVAVNSQNEEVIMNFGKQPFLFDIEAYVMEEKTLQQQETLEKLSLPPHVSHWIVRSYLLHYGYQDTLNSYDITSESMYPLIPKVQGNGFSEQTDVYALNHRKILRELIKNGDIDSAFEKLREWYPQIVQVGNLEDAITYAQAQLAKYFNVRPFSELLGVQFYFLIILV